jgi:hypothetical protein
VSQNPWSKFDPEGLAEWTLWDDVKVLGTYDFWNRVDPSREDAVLPRLAADWGKISVDYSGRTGALASDTLSGAGDSYNAAVDGATDRMFHYHDNLGRNWASSWATATIADPVLSSVGVNGMLEGGFGITSMGQELDADDRCERGALGLFQAATTAAGLRESWLPQNVSRAEFKQLSNIIREDAGKYSDDIAVHGSSAKGTGAADADLDVAVRVSPDEFTKLIKERFGTPNPNSAWERTMLRSIKDGRIQTGEAGLRKSKNQVRSLLNGRKTQISIVEKGGKFDNGPYLQLKKRR